MRTKREIRVPAIGATTCRNAIRKARLKYREVYERCSVRFEIICGERTYGKLIPVTVEDQ